jgi:predicted peptidase
MRKLTFYIFLYSILLFSCSKKDEMNDYTELENLPMDAGGIQSAHALGTTNAYYGYYAYTPSVYSKNGPKYPLLLFLHGAGEQGNSSNDASILDIVLRNGPPMLIKDKKWTPKYPMIVVSPQAHDGGWNAVKVHQFIKYLIDNYEINTQRIYITGLSMGGYGTFSYLTTTGDSCYAAAAVPICGGGNSAKVSGMKHIPVWAFHGEADGTVNVSNSINMINAINALNPSSKAKLTIYPGVGHNSWSKTYDGTGMGTERTDYDPFDMSIYNWMFQYKWNQFKSKK